MTLRRGAADRGWLEVSPGPHPVVVHHHSMAYKALPLLQLLGMWAGRAAAQGWSAER